jgi:hypothetical protein
MEEMLKSWMMEYRKVVKMGMGWKKVMKGRMRKGYDKEIEEMKQEMRRIVKEMLKEGRSQGEIKGKRKEQRKVMQKEVRLKRNVMLRKQMREIESRARKGERGALVGILEGMGNYKKKREMGGDRKRMRKGNGEWCEGQEMKKEWQETFESVGRKLMGKKGFDEEWKREVEEAVDEWETREGWRNGEVEEEMVFEWKGLRRKVELGMGVQRWEVERCIHLLKNGKACGVDGVVGEVLKHGGEWMVESVWMLCERVFMEGGLPGDWMKVIKVPVVKKGTGEGFDEYRGVSVLSVVGKVFGKVIETRVRLFCEGKGLLVDNQFGFRENRACRDALFVLSEVVKGRGKNRVFAGFLDIAKAYPSVWRKGLWHKLLEMGINGRMLRVLKSLYARCEVGVRVGGKVEEWYEEFVGVREGCVLSPILFALYINGLAEELNAEGCGVMIGGKRMSCLMFADDIVLLADSKEALQTSLDVAWKYSRKWRFEYNFGKDKSEVMVFGGKRSRGVNFGKNSFESSG